MPRFDLVIRNAAIATAADIFSCDMGISDGRIIALGDNLEADEVIDAKPLNIPLAP